MPPEELLLPSWTRSSSLLFEPVIMSALNLSGYRVSLA